jgi:chaperonin cofactor prefoldin
MSEDARRVIKMETVLGLIAGKSGDDVSDLLRFLTQRDLSAQEEGIVAPLAKAWICSQHPPFMEKPYDPTAIYEDWVQKETKRIGDNISVAPIAEGEMAGIAAVLDMLAENKNTIAALNDEKAELEAKVAELQPFVKKSEDLEKKVGQLEGKIATLEKDNKELKSQTAEFQGKLPVAENELNDTIKDIVTKALKDAVKSVPLGAAAGGEEVAEAVAEEDTSGGVPDDFGFGASGSDGGGFGF